MPDRDPRVDPIEGDVLRKGAIEREVDEIYLRGTSRRVVYVGTHCCAPDVGIGSWRKWAKSATVVARGSE
jgi:hypothetical protein